MLSLTPAVAMWKLFLVLAVASSRAEVKKEMFMAHVQECITQIQPDSDELDSLMKDMPPTSEKGKCLQGCMFEKMGFMKDGSLDIDRIMEVMSEVYSNDPNKQALSKETILFCEKELEGQTLNSCDLATTALTCYKTKSPSLHFT